MSRYLLLILLNLPLIIAGMLGAVTRYKLRKSGKYQTVLQILLWSIIFFGLLFAEPLYEWLFSNDLTRSEPLSLFDVVQITFIVILIFSVNRLRIKLDTLEQRLQALHRELSIKLSDD